MIEVQDVNAIDAIYWELKLRGDVVKRDDKSVAKVLMERLEENGFNFVSPAQIRGSLGRGRTAGLLLVEGDKSNPERLSLAKDHECDNPFDFIAANGPIVLTPKPKTKKSQPIVKKETVVKKTGRDFSFINDWSTSEVLELIAHCSNVVKEDIQVLKKGIVESL